MGTGVTVGNGIHECHYVDSTHLSLYDLTNTAITETGAFFSGTANLAWTTGSGGWVSQLTPYTLGSEPLGYFDGPTGSLMRRLSLGPQNGMATSAGLVISGGSGGSCTSTPCTITVTTTYNPIAGQGNFGVAAGNRFSVTGTGTSLDTCGDGTESSGAQSPYTMASVSSSGWLSNSFTCSGLTTGDKTSVNMTCGPAATPNDTIGGTQSCTRVSQMATTANPWWTGMKLAQTSVNNADLTSANYKTFWDGGNAQPGNQIMSGYAMGAIRFLVDPTSTFYLGQIIYALNHVERLDGVSFNVVESADIAVSNFVQNNNDFAGLAILYAAAVPYWTGSEKTTFLDKLYNDLDDPTYAHYSGGSSQCTKEVASAGAAGVDLSNPVNHNWVLATGLAQAGTNDATHITLASSAHCVVGSVIQLSNGYGYNSDSYGLVTSCSGATATLSAGWFNGQGGAGTAPGLNSIVSLTYQGGLSNTGGTTGQACWLGNGGYQGGSFLSYVTLTGPGTLPASGTALPIGNGSIAYGSAPTSLYPITTGSSPATCTGTASVTATLGTAYTVFDTFKLGSTSQGTPTTATFTTTNFSTTGAGTISTGDAIIGSNGWANSQNNDSLSVLESYVCAIGPGSSSACGSTNCGTLTASQLCVIPNTGLSSSLTSTAAQAWRVPQWAPYDCGFIWLYKHGSALAVGAVAAVYPPAGGLQIPVRSNTIFPEGGNLGSGDIALFGTMDLAAANDDSRAIRDLSRSQSFSFDYNTRHWMDYSGGYLHDGAGYSTEDRSFTNLNLWGVSQSLAQSSPAYPTMDLTGPWAHSVSIQTIFSNYPDNYNESPGSYYPFLLNWGGTGSTFAYSPFSEVSIGLPFDSTFIREPQSDNAGYLRNWIEHIGVWGGAGGTQTYTYAPLFLFTDPRVADVSYSSQPSQYAFIGSSSAACASTTGWPCYQSRGDMVISRGPWLSGGSPNLAATLLHAEFQTYTSGYDTPCPGSTRLYKAGFLLNPDAHTGGTVQSDCSIGGDAIQLGGPQSNQFNEFLEGGVAVQNTNPEGKITISYWGGQANSGSFSTQYGDSQGRYAYVSGNVLPAYNLTGLALTGSGQYANRSLFHSKPASGDEFVFQVDDININTGNPTKVSTHLQYAQTGQQLLYPTGASQPTGKTFCVNSSYAQVACSTLNTNRLIEEVEDGGEYSGNPPARDYGLMTWFTSPGTITLNWDTPGAYTTGNQPQASPSNTYTDGSVSGLGYSNRVTVAAGSSVGGSVSGESTWLIVHKVMQNLTDTTFTRTAFNPSSAWTGAQACGATSCSVYMQALGNALQSTFPGITTTHSLPAQYLIAGLAPGNYTLTVGGTQVFSGAVPTGDTTIFATAAAGGAVVLSAGTGPGVATAIGGTVKVSGAVIIH